MELSLNGKSALITGGSKGIGKAIAKTFAEAGAKVMITSRKADVCELAAEEIGHGCVWEAGNVGDPEHMEAAIERSVSELGGVDVLVNNAGAVWGEPLESFSEVGWDKVMDLNVKTIFFMIQTFLPMLKKNAKQNSKTRVINIGSIDGINTPYYENYSYSVAKAAVHKLTKVLSAKLISDNIICNAIAPGPFPSKMLGSAVEHDYSIIAKKNPSKRVGGPEDIAGLAIFLASKASEYTIGEVVSCDGGLVASAGHDLTND